MTALPTSPSLDRLGSAARTFVAKRKQLFIGGSWQDANSGLTLAVIDPAYALEVDRIPAGSAEDIDRAVSAARAAFEGAAWSRMAPADRARLIWRLADLLEANAQELAELEALDNGKPVSMALGGDVVSAQNVLRYMAGWATKITGETIPLSSPGDFHAYTLREPIGVCGLIVPWNFPLMMAVWKLAPALASGCTMVLKPAEQTSLTALRLAELIEEAGFPAGVVNVVTGTGEAAGAPLAAHPGIDKIAFTGSTAVGRKILDAARGNLKKVSLELGGKSPMIVFSDADLDIAIPEVAAGIFYNMGQTCTAGTRLYVDRRIADALLDGVAAYGRALRIGPGLDPATEMGPLVSAEHLDKVAGYVAAGLGDGARLVSGGNRPDGPGYFIEPTVLSDTHAQMTVVKEEIFGPVLAAQSINGDDFDAVIRAANDSIYGLAGSIFTRDINRAHRTAKALKAGTIGINAHHVVDAALPFGGFGQSGWGREMGWSAIELYTELKSIGVKLIG